MKKWANLNSEKYLSRNYLANGNFTGKRRGYKAHRVASLVGFDPVSKVGSMCVKQGIAHGYIAPDAEIYAIERDEELANEIANEDTDLNLTVYNQDFANFHPPKKLDLLILDLMCSHQDWIGKKLVDDIVPMMSARRSGIGINLNIQRPTTNKQHQHFRDLYMQDKKYWDSLWKPNLQSGIINPSDPHDPPTPYSGVRESNLSALATFVSVHQHMRETDFSYHGCYRYYERSHSEAGPQYMLSMRYERKK